MQGVIADAEGGGQGLLVLGSPSGVCELALQAAEHLNNRGQ
jgi:hypothetical protein